MIDWNRGDIPMAIVDGDGNGGLAVPDRQQGTVESIKRAMAHIGEGCMDVQRVDHTEMGEAGGDCMKTFCSQIRCRLWCQIVQPELPNIQHCIFAVLPLCCLKQGDARKTFRTHNSTNSITSAVQELIKKTLCGVVRTNIPEGYTERPLLPRSVLSFSSLLQQIQRFGLF